VSVVLDTLPMSGGTSCVIPMWMGVPVITIAGPKHAHRFGAAMVTHAGLPELAARDEEDYLRIAARLANDPKRLASLRLTLRDTVRCSNLMDARGRAADVEAAYRDMWRRWCDGKTGMTT
jgi:protein O-GlcNAc transferase